MIAFTIGHSTRSNREVVELLRESQIGLIVDVRRFPASRTNPQFNAETLAATLASENIGYRHLRSLGGRRSAPATGSPSRNGLWRVAAFRAYADYAETAEFRAGFEVLMTLIRDQRVAIMCAEAVWWRCHRKIVADYLITRDVTVYHIMGKAKLDPARLTAGAVIDAAGGLTYPAPGEVPRLPGL